MKNIIKDFDLYGHLSRRGEFAPPANDNLSPWQQVICPRGDE